MMERCLRISVQVEKTDRGSVWAHALVDFDYVRAERVGLMTLDFVGVREMDDRFRAWAADVCPSEDNDGWLQHAFYVAPVWADDTAPVAERGLVPGTWFLGGRCTARGPSQWYREREPARESLRIVVFDGQTAYDPMPWRVEWHWSFELVKVMPVVATSLKLNTQWFGGEDALTAEQVAVLEMQGPRPSLIPGVDERRRADAAAGREERTGGGGLVMDEETRATVEAIRAEEADRLPWVGTVTVKDPPVEPPKDPVHPDALERMRRCAAASGVPEFDIAKLAVAVEQTWPLLRTPTPDPSKIFTVTPVPCPATPVDRVRQQALEDVIRDEDKRSFAYVYEALGLCAACGGSGKEPAPLESKCHDWGTCRACRGTGRK
jgi:hypothetical protein